MPGDLADLWPVWRRGWLAGAVPSAPQSRNVGTGPGTSECHPGRTPAPLRDDRTGVHRMRVIRPISLAVVASALALGCGACVSTVSGHATAAADLGTGLPTSTDSPTDAPSPTTQPTTPDPPSPTVDPVKTKEQVTCVLI